MMGDTGDLSKLLAELERLERTCIKCGGLFYANPLLLERARAKGRDVRVCSTCVWIAIDEIARSFERKQRRQFRMRRKRRRGWA